MRVERHTVQLWQDWGIGLVLFAIAFWHFLGEVPNTDFHRDEARWIHRSYFLEELRHPDSDLWRTDSLLTLGQPPLGNYLMGIGLLIQGRELKPNGFYDFTHNLAWNTARGNVPDLPDLHAGRRTNAFVGALTVMVVYFIGRRLVNRVAGVAGALVLIPHPLNVYLNTFAGSDALLVFLVALAGLVAIALADRPSWPKAILLGVLLGLGGATKLTPLLLSVPLGALGLALLLYGLPARLRGDTREEGWTGMQDASDRRPLLPSRSAGPLRSVFARLRPARPLSRDNDLGWMLLVLPVVAFTAFVLVYPYLWPDPWTRTDRLFDFRTQEMTTQSEIWEQTRVNGPFEAIERVRLQLGERTSTSGWLAAEFLARFNRTWDKPDLDLKLGTLGLALLAVWALMYGPRSRYAMATLVIGGEAALIVVGMQVDFNRYHLPILLAIVVGIGFLAGQAWNGIAFAGSTVAALRGGPDYSFDAIPFGEGESHHAGDEAPAGVAPLAVVPRSPSSKGQAPMVPDAMSRSRPVLLAGALALGVLIGHTWANLRALTRNGNGHAGPET